MNIAKSLAFDMKIKSMSLTKRRVFSKKQFDENDHDEEIQEYLHIECQSQSFYCYRYSFCISFLSNWYFTILMVDTLNFPCFDFAFL